MKDSALRIDSFKSLESSPELKKLGLAQLSSTITFEDKKEQKQILVSMNSGEILTESSEDET